MCKEHFGEDGNRLTQAYLAEKMQQHDPFSPLNEIIIGKIKRGERAMLPNDSLPEIIARTKHPNQTANVMGMDTPIRKIF